MKKQIYSVLVLILLATGCTSSTLVSKKSVPMVVVMNADWGYIPQKPANDGVLNFSQLVPGTGATRQINVTNDHPMPLRMIITQQGPIKKYISVNMNNITLNAHESITINVTAWIPDQAVESAKKEEGMYEGQLNIELYNV